MGYGFKAINNSGFIQIDENSTAFQVLETGTTGTGYVTIPDGYPEDILVVVRPSNPDPTKAYYVSGFMSDTTPSTGPNSGVRFRRAYMSAKQGYTYGLPCDYAIIERVDSSDFIPPTSGFGLNIYKDNGDLGFSSEFPTYRVAATRNYNISASNSGDGIWYTPPSGKNVLGMYTFLSSFELYRARQYSTGGNERGYLRYYRYALFDYPNNQFGLDVQSSYSDGPNGGSIYDYVWSGYRTEMIGEIT